MLGQNSAGSTLSAALETAALRRCVVALALGIGLAGAISDARSQIIDMGKYPNMTGGWGRSEVYPWARGERPPLTPEYQAVWEASVADRAKGGHGTDTMYRCFPPGMPRVMLMYSPMELVITPGTTYMLIDHIHDDRRIFTDGRAWPEGEVELSYNGHSIGKWIDEDGDGKYDVLEVETRGFTGPRAYDASGIPLHDDNQTIVRERLHLDKNDRNLLLDEVTVIDHALTRPWSVLKSYRRLPDPQPMWIEEVCGEGNNHVQIGNESYMLSGEGYLMPTKKGQQPPDLKYFKRPGK
jgi:hypothetical protein